MNINSKIKKNNKSTISKNKIKLLIMDVDGVFTDGSVYVDSKGKELLKFSRIDGKGIELIRNNNILTGVISQENSITVRFRMQKLKIDFIALGIRHKIEIYKKWQRKLNIENKNICVCGDDISDIQILKEAGLSCAPSNAVKEVKSIVDYVSELKGGEGFVREICNIILDKKDFTYE